MDQLKSIIENAFEIRAEINPKNAPKEIKDAVDEVLNNLNNGSLRVATRIKDSQEWETHQWIKKAVLLSFRLYDNEVMKSGYTNYFDKVHSKNIIEVFYPQISNQVVLLPLLEKELSFGEFELLKPNLNKMFMIESANGNSEILEVKSNEVFNQTTAHV